MSLQKTPIKNYRLQNNLYSSRSVESNRRNNPKMSSVKKTRLTISAIKPSESCLMKENQECYLYRYQLQDDYDDTNVVFFDANSRKFRTRSTAKKQILSNYKNVETSEKKEERTLILVPGQTIERQSKVENFENPTEEFVKNPDGTYSSVFKQTKVTTITENTPLGVNKIKSLEGEPELPIYKQKITYLYDTVTSVKNKSNLKDTDSLLKLGGSGKNNENNGNLGSGQINGLNSGMKGKLGLGISGKKGDKYLNEEKHFDSSVIPKGFKNEKDLENFLENMNKKGNKLTPKEKEKRYNCIKDLFNNIAKGKNPDENIEKLAQLLENMSEKDRKEILEKLGKDTKNINLLKKLQNALDKQVSNKNLEKGRNRPGYDKTSGKDDSNYGKRAQKDNYGYGKGLEKDKSGFGKAQSGNGNTQKGYDKNKSVYGNAQSGNDKNQSGQGKGQTGYGKNQSGYGKDKSNNGNGFDNNQSGLGKGFSSSNKFESGIKGFKEDTIEVKEISPLKFDGLFLEISKYGNGKREQNPFEGPSPYIEFYKERKIKIRNQINIMAPESDERASIKKQEL